MTGVSAIFLYAEVLSSVDILRYIHSLGEEDGDGHEANARYGEV